MLTSSGVSAKIWSLDKYKILFEARHLKDYVASIVLGSDCITFATGGEDNKIIIWNILQKK